MSSSSTINCCASTINTDTSRRPKSKESDQQNRKKKKHQRNRHSKRCKNQHQKLNTINQPSNHHAIFTTHRWTWKTSKTKTFSVRQNRQLFKGHSICTKIGQRKTAIFNFQFTITTLRSKDHKDNISTAIVTSSATSSSESSNAIKPLEDEI